ncbi:hypothetical protein F5Y04DRAFT_248650 [Hypomontagnella monticulosa]|nr:hypothetical protein F5Y04DRAFT_248650 [Hypomontagnella monticulosa]
MANLTRVPRLWPLSPLQSRALSPVLPGFYRRISTTTTRPYAVKARGPRRSRSSLLKSGRNQGGNGLVQMEASVTMLLPNTLVAPPVWRYPRQPSKFVHMLWLHIRARLESLWGVTSVKILSQPTMLVSRPRFKFQKSAAIPTAKALHIQMSEAMAIGDKETLRQICTIELFQTLAATIETRPKGTHAEWELVRYDRKLFFPRLADWRLGYQPMRDGGMRMVKQAVVSIASVQRIARYDDTRGGIRIEGSERVRHMTEHIVIQSEVDRNTYESGPWKIWGTLSENTYEGYLAEKENFEVLAAAADKM